MRETIIHAEKISYAKDGSLRILLGSGLYKAGKFECWYCGKTFWGRIKPSPRFCSKVCCSKQTGKLRRARRRVGKRCVVCNAIFYMSAAKIAHYSTCGKPDCRYERRRQQGVEWNKRTTAIRRARGDTYGKRV